MCDHPQTLEEARRCGQDGWKVQLWPKKANGKSAYFKVTEDDKLTINGINAFWYDLEKLDSFRNIVSEKSYRMKVVVKVDQMTIYPEKEFLSYSERHFTESAGFLLRYHCSYYTQKIKIILPDPFCFENGSNIFELESNGNEIQVDPISFFIK